jgi:hypothetical protein
MQKNIFFPILLFLSILILLLFSLTAGAAEVTPPTTAEVVDEVARFTGLSSDLTQLVLESEPELLAKFGKTVFGVQVLNQLLEAKDTEVMKSIFNLAVSNLADYLMKQALHPAVGTFLGVVKAYKASLEVVRDYIIIPKFDNDTYIRYKKARGGVLDYGYANPTEAFEEATFAPFGGYYLLKEKRYKELIKAKGYNPELIGDKLEASLRRKIDDFWMKRMEAKYVQERLKESQEALVKSIWKTAQSEIDLLNKLILELGTIHAGLFIDISKDLPEGWWFVKPVNEVLDGKPHKSKDSNAWVQTFYISDAKGYKWDADERRYFRIIDQNEDWRFPPTISVTVVIYPRFQEVQGGLWDDAHRIQFLIDNTGFQPVGSLGAACIGRAGDYVSMMCFYRGMYFCDVNIRYESYRQIEHKPDIAKYEKLLRYFSRIVAGKMPAIVIENP